MGPEEALNDSSEHQIVALPSRSRMQTSLDERQRLLMLEGNARESGGACVPIIEEPNSPEYIQDIEDIPFTEGTDSVEVVEENIDLEPSARGGGSMLYVELNQTSVQHVSQEFCMDSPSKGAQQEPDGCIEAVVEELTPQVPSEEVAFPNSRELVLLPLRLHHILLPSSRTSNVCGPSTTCKFQMHTRDTFLQFLATVFFPLSSKFLW